VDEDARGQGPDQTEHQGVEDQARVPSHETPLAAGLPDVITPPASRESAPGTPGIAPTSPDPPTVMTSRRVNGCTRPSGTTAPLRYHQRRTRQWGRTRPRARVSRRAPHAGPSRIWYYFSCRRNTRGPRPATRDLDHGR
jgi:hypothetical protein